MWSSLPGAKSEDPATIFRCGQLSNAGKIALGTHQIVSQATRLCFNIKGNTNNWGEAIIPYPCGTSTNMQFFFVDQGSGLYSIHNCERDARPLLEHIYRCVIARRREKIWRPGKSHSVELQRLFPF